MPMRSDIKDTDDFFFDKPSLAPTPSTNSLNQRYQILTRIGSGGMGDVFLGIQRGAVDFQRLIVLKRIHAHLFDQPVQKQMFVDEASLVASLDHPHIVKIIDFRQTETSFYIIMEYVDGETLKIIRSICQKKNIPFPFPLACKLILEACEALHYAHNATSRQGKPLNMIHRDIGLHNLMIDRNGYLKVIDFGIAKSELQTDKTNPGFLKGNPGYMAPDLFRYNRIDNRVDIYGLGLCLYELLTLQRAYNFGKNVELVQIIQHITTNELLPAPSSIVPSVPSELDAIVAKATAVNRDLRYQSAAEFSADLKKVASKYSSEFEQCEMKDWFNSKLSERILERIRFEQEVMESAKTQTDSKFISINSYAPPPGGIPDLITSGSLSLPSVGGTKRIPWWIILGGLLLFLLISVTASYFLFVRISASTGTGNITESQAYPNLFIQSTPPGAFLYVDGKLIGTVTDDGISFRISPDEQHRVNLKKSGFLDYSIPIFVPKNGQRQIDALMKPIEPISNAKVAPSQPSDEPPALSEVELSTSISQKTLHRRKGKRPSEVDEEADPPSIEESVQPKVEIPLLDSTKGSNVSAVPLLDEEKKKSDKPVPLL